MSADRKTAFKLPPTTRDKLVSQEARRSKALEEQKRRRAQKIDSSRQLDQFADLNLGSISDDEDEDEPAFANVTSASVARYATMIEPSMPLNAITGTLDAPGTTFGVHEVNPKQKSKKKKKKKTKPSKWADKCMYAELLEMSPEGHWSSDGDGTNDGLPSDLETAWVAVAPVPVGKRCLAITHQSAGVVGVVPNTTLRSRLLGKTLIPRFPSTLPPLTILDCILDANWRDNGILHVLDVVKWKGQDVCDCEAPFRFWWRDTRLAELSQTFPPNISFSTIVNTPPDPSLSSSMKPRYFFPYPTKFLPVPYHTDTSLATLQSQIIPLARTIRGIDVEVPVAVGSDPTQQGTMDMDSPSQSSFTFRTKAPVEITSVATTVEPDGLLLYISEASYEAGTSPLSSWIPINGYEYSQPSSALSPPVEGILEGPLDIFQRLVKCRLEKKALQFGQAEYMDIEM